MDTPTRARTKRLVLTVPGDTFAALAERARRELRPTKAEALHLIIDGLRRREPRNE